MSKPVMDKFGREYDVLLRQQKTELAHWKTVLRPEAFSALSDYCEMVNGPADPRDIERISRGGTYKAGGLHTVPVGCELHHFVMKIGKTPIDHDLL